MGEQKSLFDELTEGFDEVGGDGDDDDLFKAFTSDGFDDLSTPKRRAKPKHYRTEFVCKVCAQAKNGRGLELCNSCNEHLGRIMAVYTEAALSIPGVKKMKLSEFVERLWEREKERRRVLSARPVAKLKKGKRR